MLFKNDSDRERLDWRLLQNGPVALYLKPKVLKDDTDWLLQYGYAVKQFECSNWTSMRDIHEAFATVFGFPSEDGNLDTLSDHLADITMPETGGIALVFNRFDAIIKAEGETAQGILDVVAQAARYKMLFGQTVLALVQTNDSQTSFAPVGATPVTWNPREWPT